MAFAFSPVTGLNDITQFPSKDAAIRAHIQALLQQIPDYVDAQLPLPRNYANDTGVANVYVVTLSPALTSYVVGQVVSFKATNANTGISTLNANAVGIKTIKKNVNVDLVAGDILAGQMVTCVYDGTNFQIVPDYANLINTALLSANGWFKDKKTGVIIQWGHGIAVKSTNTSFTLPLTFPNALLWTGCVGADIGLTNISMHIASCTTSILSINNQNTNDYTAYWIAIGY